MAAASSADTPRSYGDIRRWGDDTRWELVEGQAFAMTGPSWQHQAVAMGLSAQLLSYFRPRGCRVLPAPFDVRLPRGSEPDDAIDTVLQPDISVVCELGKLDERGCRGAPDLVVEVLSPSTADRDHLTKRALYERHGVREYWVVHPIDRIVTIHRRRGEGGFGPPELFEAKGVQRMEGFEGLAVDWDQAFADVSAAQ
jgi:Uma2 family endonuclease